MLGKGFGRILLPSLVTATALFVLLLFSPVPSNAHSHKRIEISLTNQRLYAYENGNLVYNFAISSGKRRTPTLTGTFYPRVKIPKAKMEGGSKRRGDYYYLPNVPYIVYFYRGYGIHGTYWHNNFGRPMSHGCVNLKISDAGKIYSWIDMQTKIVITGKTP